MENFWKWERQVSKSLKRFILDIIFIVALLIIFLSQVAQIVTAQDIVYSPHAKLMLQAGNELRAFSGTVIESEDSQIKVLTCWHGTMGFHNIKSVDAQLFAPTIDNTRLSANVSLSVVKSDDDKDIMLISGPNPMNIKINRVKIGTSTIFANTKTVSYGYGESTKLIVNDSSVLNYDYSTRKDAKILSVRAPVVYGMSGGGLLYEGELYGVQSSGKDNRVSYCPANQLLEFVK